MRPLVSLTLSVCSLAAADLLRYTVRAEPFEVELTTLAGVKQTRQLPRQPAYFIHRANVRWPMPDGPDATPLRCEIEWIGFPADWRLINSYGFDRRSQKFETTLGLLKKAVFAGGHLRTARSPKGLLLVTPSVWKQTDREILDLADRLTVQHTAVFRDEGLPDYQIFMVPTQSEWKGEGRTKGLFMEGSPEQQPPATFSQVFAHELFHMWNGRRLNWDNNEELYWFTEGFTDYYSVLAVWRSGIWSFEQTVEYFNAAARRYYTSPVRSLTPRQIVEARRSNSEAVRFPYDQGFLMAANWNISGMSLDRAMRNLRHENREILSTARIAKAMRLIGVETADNDIQRFILEGKTIELRPNIWGGCATETKLELRGFDLGFDRKSSEKSMIIQGANPESNAWKAGIRDGQKWQPIDVAYGDAGSLVDIEITDEKGTRRVKYSPTTASVAQVPQYKATSRQCDPATLKPR